MSWRFLLGAPCAVVTCRVGRFSFLTLLVENLSSIPQRQASLYHFDLGVPALANGTVVESSGRRLLGPLEAPDERASREATSHPLRGGPAQCCVVTGDLILEFSWSAATLPYLLWHDLRRGTCVLSVEPCTSERLPGGAERRGADARTR